MREQLADHEIKPIIEFKESSDKKSSWSAVFETTGYSPSQMLFGCDLRLPADLFSRPSDAPLAPEEYVEKLQAQMEEMHHLAGERIGMASEMKTRYDARATGHNFHEGDKNNESETLFDPCLPVGFNRELEIKSLSEKPCLMNEYFIQWMKNHPNINKLIVIGASNYTLCKKSVDYILDESSCKDLGFNQCLKAPNLGSLNIKFMAFSGFYYVVNFLNATGSLDKLISATKEWCNMTWDEIKQSQPESQLQYVSRYCFAATYIIELLTSKYGFDSTSWKNLEFSNQIEGADVGWSLGFMIYATNGITEELPSPPVISLGIFVPLLIVSISMAFVSILVLRSHVKHIFHRDHERLLNV
ncbi:ectonucleoside triphosphate diphosphohydrolase 1 [Trichonephila clavipes]|nr:ectonucleoside triphosphate diphosphohydrolase 1 [Trichonephila clavipes]